MKRVDWTWPGGKRVAVIFNVCLEAWSDGKAPGISPMGNPLPAGALDTMAISWASYGVKVGLYRLLDAFAAHNTKASVMTNAIVAERAPAAVKAIAEAGHEVLSHSYAMDVIPALLAPADQQETIARCTDLLRRASGAAVEGWLSPRGTSSPDFPRLLAKAGYKWHGDVFDDDLPYVQEFEGKKIVAIPLSTDVNDMPFMKYGNPPRSMLDAFEENLSIARETTDRPSLIDVTVHAHIFGRPRGAYYLERIVAQTAAANDIWVARRIDIAEFMLKR